MKSNQQERTEPKMWELFFFVLPFFKKAPRRARRKVEKDRDTKEKYPKDLEIKIKIPRKKIVEGKFLFL